MHKALPGAMRESTATHEVVEVPFVQPDVAAVKVRQRPVRVDGPPILDDHESPCT
jgi:hypothetical protein